MLSLFAWGVVSYIRAVNPTQPQSHKDIHEITASLHFTRTSSSVFKIPSTLPLRAKINSLLLLEMHSSIGNLFLFLPFPYSSLLSSILPRVSASSAPFPHLFFPLLVNSNGQKPSLELTGPHDLWFTLSIVTLQSLRCSQGCVIGFMSF